MWSQITNVTDGQTTCDRKTALCTMHSASRGNNDNRELHNTNIETIAENVPLLSASIENWSALQKYEMKAVVTYCMHYAYRYSVYKYNASTQSCKQVGPLPSAFTCILLQPIRVFDRSVCFCLRVALTNDYHMMYVLSMERILCFAVYLCVCLQPFAVADSCKWKKKFNFQPLDTVM